MSIKRSERGFTLAELLVAVAIIATLVGIAVPIYNKQLEKSRETVDFSNARSLYTAVIMAAANNDPNAAVNGAPIKQADGSFKAEFYPLKQRVDGWSSNVENMSISGVTSSQWVGLPQAGGSCIVKMSPTDGKVTIIWGNAYAHMTLAQLHAINNDKRVAEDQETLKALGKAILDQGWTKDELWNELGILGNGNAIRIADYYQLKQDVNTSAGFKITSKTGGELETLLQTAGYDGGNVKSTSTANGKTDTTYTNSLFFSDELATNQFHNYALNQTKRSIIIENIKTGSDGKISSMTIYTKAMDEQANMNNAEKAKFKFTIS